MFRDIRIFSLTAVFLVSGAVSALELKELPPSPAQPLPIVDDGSTIACADLPDRLEKYRRMRNEEHEQAINQFMSNVVLIARDDWYKNLKVFEGGTKEIPVGTFSVLERAANEIERVTNLEFDNAALLSLELDRIIQAVNECVALPSQAD